MDSTTPVVVNTDVVSFLFKNHSLAPPLGLFSLAGPWQVSFADAWIAAAALQLNVPLVTHNAGDYGAVEDLMRFKRSVQAGTRP